MLEYHYNMVMGLLYMLWGFRGCMVVVHYGYGEWIQMSHNMAWMMLIALTIDFIGREMNE